jgi:hypothetical protein
VFDGAETDTPVSHDDFLALFYLNDVKYQELLYMVWDRLWPGQPSVCPGSCETEASDAFIYEVSGALEYDWLVKWRMAISS